MYQNSYQVNGNGFEVRLIASTSTRSHFEVTFPTPRPTEWEEGNIVYGDYFIPPNVKKSPLLILVHGYGNESIATCLILARLFSKQGISSFVLYLPIHSRRLPKTMEEGFRPADSQIWLATYRRSVEEIIQIVDWASTREEIDSQKIGVVGFSFGGMVSSIAMASCERISIGVFIVIGGNMEELSWSGVNEILPVGHTCTREECHAVYSQYPAYLKEIEEKGVDGAVPAKECFLFDPLTFANRLRKRPVLMINAREDEIVSQHATLNFWEASGKPKLIWLSGNHAGVYSQSTLISAEINGFLNSIQVDT